MSAVLEICVAEKEEGKTVEALLKKHFDISTGLLRELKYSGRLTLNNEICKSVDKAKSGDKILADVSETSNDNENILPFQSQIEVLYEDDFLLAVNKPGGVECHPCPSNRVSTLANSVMYYWKQKGEYHNCHIVNRLDKGTSGICIIAKNRFCHHQLSKQMKNKDFKKYYFAIVHGKVDLDEGEIELPIDRCDDSIIKRRVAQTGKYAKTLYKKIAGNERYSLLDIRLETGRTHQIRTHFSYIGHALVGDWLYGNGDRERNIIDRQALHSYKVEFFHPKTKELISIETDIPMDMKNIICF